MMSHLVLVCFLAVSVLSCKKDDDDAPAYSVTLDGTKVTLSKATKVSFGTKTTLLAVGKSGSKDISVSVSFETPTASKEFDCVADEVMPIYIVSSGTTVESNTDFGRAGEKVKVTKNGDTYSVSFTNLSEFPTGSKKLSASISN